MCIHVGGARDTKPLPKSGYLCVFKYKYSHWLYTDNPPKSEGTYNIAFKNNKSGDDEHCKKIIVCTRSQDIQILFWMELRCTHNCNITLASQIWMKLVFLSHHPHNIYIYVGMIVTLLYIPVIAYTSYTMWSPLIIGGWWSPPGVSY